jgi:hypothetical protein
MRRSKTFLNGLNDGLAYALEARDFKNFQGMVNKILVLENRRGVTEPKRKLVCQNQSGSNSRPRVATPTARPMFHPAQSQFQPRLQTAGHGFSTLQCQVIPHPNKFQTPADGSQNVQRTQATQDLPQADRRCFNCGEKGHYAN